MSIVVLKRKAAAQYNNLSVGQKGFSITGTHRNQGYIGQSNQSRFLSRTLMNGDTPRGHGGCCGKYNIGEIVQSSVNSTEDSSVVKSSSLNTLGLIETKYRWAKRGYPYTSVKPDSNQHHTQGDYIRNLSEKTIQNSCHVVDECENISRSVCTGLTGLQRSSITRQVNGVSKLYTKPLSYTGALNDSDHILLLKQKCQAFNKTFPSNTQNKPLPGNGVSR